MGYMCRDGNGLGVNGDLLLLRVGLVVIFLVLGEPGPTQPVWCKWFWALKWKEKVTCSFSTTLILIFFYFLFYIF